MLDGGQLVGGQAGIGHLLESQLGALVQQEVHQLFVVVLDGNVERCLAGFSFLWKMKGKGGLEEGLRGIVSTVTDKQT